MRNRKAAIVLTLVMAMALLGNGCSGQNAETGNTNTAEAEAST